MKNSPTGRNGGLIAVIEAGCSDMQARKVLQNPSNRGSLWPLWILGSSSCQTPSQILRARSESFLFAVFLLTQGVLCRLRSNAPFSTTRNSSVEIAYTVVSDPDAEPINCHGSRGLSSRLEPGSH